MKKFQRGSEWRRWDLHLHTPFTKLSNNYIGDTDDEIWDAYISALEESPVKAFGITDYFSCDNYFKLVERYQIKFPSSRKVFFPNIELRLSETIDKGNGNPDIHIIFDNDPNICSAETLNKFLSNLKTIAENDDDVRISCGELKTTSQYESASVALHDIKKALKSTFGNTKPYLLVFPANNDGIRSTDNHSPRKISSSNQIDKACDLFFGNSNNQTYFLRDDRYLPNQVKSKPKPVVSFSDAHSFEELKRLEGNVSTYEPTWIKADLTFRGLKQICHEPEARVFIGNTPPVHTRKENEATKFIDKLCVDQVPDYNGSNGQWFKKTDIPLNSELVAIIGNKGSGKSSLVDIIGLLTDSRQHKYFSFLVDGQKNKKFKQKGYAENYIGTIHWLSSKSTEKHLNDSIDFAQPETVRYLPQNYFEHLTNDIEIQEFRKEIEQVVFSHVEESDKMRKSSFHDLQEFKTQQSLNETSTLKARLRELNFNLVKLEEEADPLEKKKLIAQLQSKESELEALEKSQPIEVLKPTAQTPEQQKISSQIENMSSKMVELSTKKTQIQEQLSNKKEQLQKLVSLSQNIQGLGRYVNEKKIEIEPACNSLGLSLDEIVSFSLDTNSIDETISAVKTAVETLEKDNTPEFSISFTFANLSSFPDLSSSIKYLNTERDKLKNDLGAPQRKYQTYLEKLTDWNTAKQKIIGKDGETHPETISYIKTQLNYIDNELAGKISNQLQARYELCKKIYDSKKQILEFYSELKKSVDTKLHEVHTSDFSVNIEASFVLGNDFSDSFFKFINRNRRGFFYGRIESQTLLNTLVDNVNWGNFDSVFQFQKSIFQHLKNHNDQSMSIKEQVSNIKDLYDFIFSMEYFDAKYELKLGDKNLNELSPGEKGLLLLIFYLQLDNNNIPLVIDQPEDNLDNDSIFAVLAQCIRSAKKNRQIILVTHNPNLAVGADAEQIIYVKLDKTNNYKFSYECGSIENPEINRKIVDVLEGSQPAFVKRRLKYEI